MSRTKQKSLQEMMFQKPIGHKFGNVIKAILIFLSVLTAGSEVFAQKGLEDKRNAFNNRRFYARTTRMRNHVILLQLAQLPQSLRLSYEHRFNKMFMAGVHASLRFGGMEAGTVKSEFYGKYFTNQRCPQGLYLFAELGLALVRNYAIEKNLDIQSITTSLNESQIRNLAATISARHNFFTFCTGTGFGFQNVYGPGRRTMIDFALGLRWYHIPNRYKKTETNPGAADLPVTYTKIKPNYSPLTSLSPFTFRVGIGYLF